MTVEEFQQEKAKLVALYGEAPREASGRRAQAFARLYVASELGERALAEIEGVSKTRVHQLLVFGKFLTAVVTQGDQIPSMHEKQFRNLWDATEATHTEAERFKEIQQRLRQGHDKPRTGPDRQAVRRLSKQLIEQFADGKWHALRDMTEAVEADSIMIRGIMDRMVKDGTFQTFAERKSSGKGWYSYRMVKGGKKKIDLQVFQTEITPTLEEMETLINGHAIHFSQAAMKMAFTQFRKVIDTLTR
jgi:hypothetical protein